MHGHRVKRNHTTRTPSNLLFLDCETRPSPVPGKTEEESHSLRLGVAIHVRLNGTEVVSRRVFRFNRQTQLWRWIVTRLSPKHPLWVFAHNLAFDLTVSGFWDRLTNEEYVWTDPRPPKPSKGKNGGNQKPRRGYALTDDPPTMLRCFHHSGATLVACDTLNYWRTSLDKLAKSVGMEKLQMPPWDADDRTWFDYCENDTAVIERAVIDLIRFVRENDLGCWKGTLPGLAYSAWRHRFMNEEMVFDHKERATALARAGYFGGEGKCWFLGQVRGFTTEPMPEQNPWHPCHTPVREGPVYRLDLTAAYAWAMQAGNLPVRLQGVYRELPIRTLKQLACSQPVSALIEYADTVHAAPVRFTKGSLLRRGESDGTTDCEPITHDSRVYYARGHFLTVLVGDELAWALRNGSVKKCHAYAQYESGDPFSAFVDYFWQLRCKAEDSGDTVKREFAKHFYTNLSGRFGMRAKIWRENHAITPEKPWGYFYGTNGDTGKTTTYRSLGWLCQEKGETGETMESFPILPACITARVRVRMRELACIAGDSECFYQATDSLHVTKTGYERLVAAGEVSEREMGKLHLEGISECVTYRGHQNYTSEGVHAVSGLKRNAVPQRDGTYKQLQFDRLQSILSSQPRGIVNVRHVGFRIGDTWDGGIVLDNGTVRPWWIARLEATQELAKCVGGH